VELRGGKDEIDSIGLDSIRFDRRRWTREGNINSKDILSGISLANYSNIFHVTTVVFVRCDERIIYSHRRTLTGGLVIGVLRNGRKEGIILGSVTSR